MNIKRVPKSTDFKYVEAQDKNNQAVLYEGRILGFIKFNKDANIQCVRAGHWLKGPRWEITHKDGTKLDNLPASRGDTGRWLLAYERVKGV